MIRTQIYLSRKEHESLRVMSKKMGKKISELIRSAVDDFLDPHDRQGKLEGLRSAMGMWSDDNVDLSSLRKTWDRK